jgi:hypothetical protein
VGRKSRKNGFTIFGGHMNKLGIFEVSLVD